MAAETKATNAYELLEDVIAAIKAEPEHYNQQEWCGTSYCVAGWMERLVDGVVTEKSGERADQILGLSDDHTWQLYKTSGPTCAYEAGTPSHAKAGERHIRAFMAKHEAHLKAQPVAPVVRAEVGDGAR